MKKVILSCLSILFASIVVSAQVTDTTDATGSQPGQTQAPGYQQGGQQGDFVKIRVDELPASVSRSLEGNEYSNWTVSNAYRNSTSGDYRVEMRSGTQTKVYTFDKDGKRTDKNKMGDQGTQGQGDQSARPDDESSSGSGSGSGSTGGSGSGSGSTGGSGSGSTTPEPNK